MLDRVTCRKTWQIYPAKCLVSVTLTHFTLAANSAVGVGTEYTVNKAREKKIRKDGQQLHDDLAAENRTVWQLYKEFLDAAEAPDPMLGDIIRGPDAETGETQAWLVEKVTKQLFGTVYNLECRRVG